MPFLAPLIPAIIGGAASAGVSAIGNALAPGGGKAVGGQDVNKEAIQAAGQQNQNAAAQQQAFVNALQAQGGLQNQSDVYNQLANVAAGQGPNPAMAALQQATGANVANQAALMAGQRGSSANTGLLARQAAQQGAGIQQNAIGQGATLQAQQSLNALSGMGNIAGQQVGNLQQGIGTLNQNALTNQAQQLGLAQSQADAQNQMYRQQQDQSAKTASGISGGIGSALASGIFGGKKMAHGGAVSSAGRHLMAQGGEVEKVDVLLSPGEVYVSPDKVKAKDPLAAGQKIPGKAKVQGDSLKNDTVPRKLEEGGVVIPRSVVNSENPKENAAKFIAAVMGSAPRKPKK